MRVKVVEQREARCRQLSEDLPKSLIIQGDGTDQELLESENLAESDAFVALTDRTRTTLIISLYALQRKIFKVVAKCNRRNYISIAGTWAWTASSPPSSSSPTRFSRSSGAGRTPRAA